MEPGLQITRFAPPAMEAFGRAEAAGSIAGVVEATLYYLARQELYLYHPVTADVLAAAKAAITTITAEQPTGHRVEMPQRIAATRAYYPALGKLPSDVLAQLIDVLDAAQAAADS